MKDGARGQGRLPPTVEAKVQLAAPKLASPRTPATRTAEPAWVAPAPEHGGASFLGSEACPESQKVGRNTVIARKGPNRLHIHALISFQSMNIQTTTDTPIGANEIALPDESDLGQARASRFRTLVGWR